MTKRVLLISTTRVYGSGYFDYCENDIKEWLGGIRRVLFVPYALHDRDAYTTMARERLALMGYEVDGIHEGDPVKMVEKAEAIYIGGGNTFRLLTAMYEANVVEPIRRRVDGGEIPYMGSSAGSNVACVTMKTTNDMPIVYPPTFDGLNLVPFNINPHYLDPDPGSTHMGETRETRIKEFHEMNDTIVVGLREGAMLWIEGPRVTLRGFKGARVFRKDREPEEYAPGANMDFLLRG